MPTYNKCFIHRLFILGVRELSTRKRIGVLVSNATNRNNVLLVKGIIKKAYSYNLDVCVFATFIRQTENTGYLEGEMNIFNLPNFDSLDGLIVLGDSIQVPALEEELEERLLTQCSCPIVVLDKESRYFPYLAVNDMVTFEHLVDHLIECHGFTKINCLTGFKGHIHAENRLKGYFRSLEKHNISVEKDRYSYGDFWVVDAAAYAHKIINGEVPMPEALVCAADYSAMEVIKELVKAGIHVPEDMAVLGYDSYEEGIAYIPSITSAEMPFDTHGSNAVIMIHNMMEGSNEPIDTKTGGNLCIAQSCGCDIDLHYQKRLKNLDKDNDYLQDFFTRSSFMKENLTSATTIEECMKEVAHNTYQLSKYQEFYVCLCEDWDEVNEILPEEWGNVSQNNKYRTLGYTDHMSMYVSDVHGEISFDRTKFSVKEMLPALNKEREYPTTYYFTPIHFIDRCFGYMVINFGKEIAMFEPQYRSWSRNINNAIEIVRSHNEMVYYNKKLNNLAVRDELTGVNNRLGFNIVAKEMIRECLASGLQFMMVLGDMDNLKGINDIYGHLQGDSAIRAVANAFAYAKGKDGYVARLGGDEFVLIMKGKFDDSYAGSVVTNICKFLHQYNATSGKPYNIHVSVGFYYDFISEMETKENDILDKYLYVADQFMYQVKQAKKNSKEGCYYCK